MDSVPEPTVHASRNSEWDMRCSSQKSGKRSRLFPVFECRNHFLLFFSVSSIAQDVICDFNFLFHCLPQKSFTLIPKSSFTSNFCPFHILLSGFCACFACYAPCLHCPYRFLYLDHSYSFIIIWLSCVLPLEAVTEHFPSLPSRL